MVTRTTSLRTTGFVVRRHRPWAMAIVVVVLLVAFAGSSWWLFHYAQERAGFDAAGANRALGDLRDKLEAAEATITELRGQIAILERAGQIDRESQLQVRDQVKELQEENLELKQELAFYRGIVSPEDRQAGLKIQSFEISPGAEPNQHRYKLILTQVLNNDRFAQGAVIVALEGLQEGRTERLGLAALGKEGSDRLEFRFKYFQNFEGDLRIPDGFQPSAIHLQVIPSTRGLKRLERTLPWQRT